MKNNLSNITIIGSILGSSLFLGMILSLIIGLSYETFVLLPPAITLVDSFLLGLAVLFSLYFSRYLVTKTRNSYILLLSFLFMLGAGIIVFVGFFITYPASFLYSNSRILSFFLINLLFFITINVVTSEFVILQQKVLDREKAVNEEKILKKQAELKFLTAKINPHFLFNSLNLLISQLKNPDKAEETLINLSELLRYQLDISDVQTVPIATELDVVGKYLAIQKQRFGDKLQYTVDCKANGEIPPLIIQPLVENSIKHNIDETDLLTINILISNQNHQLLVSVKDSMARLMPDLLERGVGLTVTKQRVEHFGGTFQIINGGIEISFAHD